MDLFIARHGQCKANTGEDPSRDSRLTEIGLRQAVLLGERLSVRRFDRILASPLARALQTAREISDRQPGGPAPVELFPELMEFNTPAGYPGASPEEIRSILPAAIPLRDAAARPAALGEEAEADLFTRADAVLDYLVDRFDREACVLCVSHGTFIRHLLMRAMGIDPLRPVPVTQVNACLNRLDLFRGEDGRLNCFRVYFLNDSRHLPEELLSACGHSELY